jgi:hypothetical protein
MSQADTPTAVSNRSRKAAITLACIFIFVLGSGLAFVLGRWSASLNADFVQTGEIRPLVANVEIDVRYPHPYASIPCLLVEEPIISFEIVQQTPRGFRIRIKDFYVNFDRAKYAAKGVPASR